MFGNTATSGAGGGGGLFGNSQAATSQPQSTGLFGSTAGANAGQSGGGGLFGNQGNASTTQNQPSSLLGGGSTNTGGGLL